MFVLCPHCQFLVAVDPVTGQPPAHCPRCDGALAPPAMATPTPAPTTDAGANGTPDVDAPIDAVGTLEPAPIPAMQEPLVEPAPESIERDTGVGGVATPDEAPAAVEAPPATAAQEPVAAGKRAPSFVRTPTADVRRSALRTWRMPLAIAALALLLVLQMLLADRAQLAADARWRPALEPLCAALRCNLPPWHEPAAFTLVDRDVRPDPRTPGVLHVRARFRNDARWPQPWPRVQLTLSDVDGRVAGARLFSPREYAVPAVTQIPIASGQVADIVMDVIEPAPGIVAFTFDFR